MTSQTARLIEQALTDTEPDAPVFSHRCIDTDGSHYDCDTMRCIDSAMIAAYYDTMIADYYATMVECDTCGGPCRL